MLNKTFAIPLFSAAAMVAFTVWALLAGPADAAHAGQQAVATTGALSSGGCQHQCAVRSTEKLAAR